MTVRVFPHMDGDRLIELVEKSEYDALKEQLRIMTNVQDHAPDGADVHPACSAFSDNLIAELTPATVEEVHAWLKAEQEARMHDWKRYNVLLNAARKAFRGDGMGDLTHVLMQLRDPRWTPDPPKDVVTTMDSPLPNNAAEAADSQPATDGPRLPK